MSPGPRTVTATWEALSKHLVNERTITWFLPCQQRFITTSLGDSHDKHLAFTDGLGMVTTGYHLPFTWMMLLSSSATYAVGVTIPTSLIKQLRPVEVKENLSKALSCKHQTSQMIAFCLLWPWPACPFLYFINFVMGVLCKFSLERATIHIYI